MMVFDRKIGKKTGIKKRNKKKNKGESRTKKHKLKPAPEGKINQLFIYL